MSDPTRVSARVTDSLSGVESAVLEFRPSHGDGSWAPLPFAETSRRTLDGTVEVSARFPDTVVRYGEYELRVVTRDAVGNQRSITKLSGGESALVRTPLRAKPTVAFGVRMSVTRTRNRRRALRYCKPRQPADKLLVRAYCRAVVEGKLTDGAGRPVAGEEVELIERIVPFRSTRVFDVVTTGPDGDFKASVPPGANRELTARYAGSKMFEPAERKVLIFAPARLSFRISDRRVQAGQKLVYRGKVLLGAAAMPKLGLKVEIRYWAGGEWHTLEDGVAVADGRFAISDRAVRVSRPLKLRLYAYVGRALDWPYIDGYSRPVDLIIRP